MTSDPKLELVDLRLQQFSLFHLMGLMTAVALTFALFVPHLRSLSSGEATVVIAILLMQFAILAGGWFDSTMGRKKVLSSAGRHVGRRTTEIVKSPTGKRILFAVFCLFFVVVQFVIVSLASISREHFPWMIGFFEAVMGFWGFSEVTQRRWEHNETGFEIFENGIVFRSFELIPWERIVVRRCKFHQDSVNLHIKSGTKYVGPTLMTIPVSEEMQSYLLKYHGEEQVDGLDRTEKP